MCITQKKVTRKDAKKSEYLRLYIKLCLELLLKNVTHKQ